MPSSMIHLWTAHLAQPNADALYLAGNIAPDSVSERDAKDRVHLRKAENRREALREYAQSLQLDDPFWRGACQHLFTDMLWDESHQADYFAEHGPDSFPDYRNEIGLASAHIFHTQPWSDDCWRALEDLPPSEYAYMDAFLPEDIRAFITRNAKWYRENRLPPSDAFPPQIVERFVREAAAAFLGFAGGMRGDVGTTRASDGKL